MAALSYPHWLVQQEARALLARLLRVKPFVLTESMLPAAALLPRAQIAIERYLASERKALRRLMMNFLDWLREEGQGAAPEQVQRRFTLLRLRFNRVLTQLDLFSDVITQRSENENGVWLSGLDVVSADALALPGYYHAPPVICYLDRGVGAAIRRARTRLPGGGENPVAIIRVPRERMVGSGIASSLIHEVGHQAAALLDLVPSLRQTLQGLQRGGGGQALAWQLWERWISEIVADFWSVARVGIVSTLGIIGVVSLPTPFVFRLNADDPHPMPWLRVKLSCAIGDALYPHPQWRQLAATWEAYYPQDGLDAEKRRLLALLEGSLPAFVSVLVNHRPKSLRGASLAEAMATGQRQPARLTALLDAWQERPAYLYQAPPSLVFAALGQGRADGKLSPEAESAIIGKLLTYWAMRSTLDASAYCAALPRANRARHLLNKSGV